MAALERQRSAAFQRTDNYDFNEQGRLALANLALAMKGFVGRSAGVVRGGDLTPDVGRFLTLGPTSAIDAAGNLLILDEETSVGEFASNGSGNPRIDLVSLAYDEDDVGVEPRIFSDQAGGVLTVETPTVVRATTAVVITTGTPSATPAPPNLPAGHVALAHVTVPSGASQLEAANIAPVWASFVRPLRYVTQGVTDPVTLTWESSPLQAVVTPAYGATFFLAQLNLEVAAVIGFRIRLVDTTNDIILREIRVATPSTAQRLTFTLLAPQAAGGSALVRDVALRVEPTGVDNAIFVFRDILIGAVTL